MHRSTSRSGWFLLALGAVALFVPLAAASNAGRATQTATMLALVGALAGTALSEMALRRRGFVGAVWLLIGALAGSVAACALIRVIHDFDASAFAAVATRILLCGVCYALAILLIVVGARRVFPRAMRGLAYAVIALLLLSLFPAPTLLMQPSALQLNVTDVRTQLHAGFLYWTVGSALLVLPFLALTTLPGDWFERWWDSSAQSVMDIPTRTFVAGLVGITFVLAAAFSWYSFDARPTTADEIAQLWHARILLSGRLALPPDPDPEFFAIDNIVDRPIWMSQFPIGGPLVMALGLAVHAAWLLNPLLTAITSWNVYRFCRRVYGEAQARVAACVVSLSPMLLLMGGTYMNHTPTACLVTLALAELPEWVLAEDSRARTRASAVIGGSIGLALAIRPLDGVIAALLFGLVMLRFAVRDRDRARSLLAGIAAGAVPVALLLAANWATTGSPTRFGYEVLWGADHSLGLHDDPTGHPHTAWRALLLGVKYAAQLNWIVTTWPVPVTLIVCAGLLFSLRPNRWDVLLLAMFAAQVTAYAFYWHDGQFIGPRFVFTAVPALLVLAARAPFIATSRLSRGTTPWRIAVAIIPVCLAVAWLRNMPPFGVRGLAREFRESRSRLKLDPPREIRTGAVTNALVFVQEGAATRLLHRLWGVGVSRSAAARLLADADGCSLLEATRAEELAPTADTAARLARIRERVKPFVRGPGNLKVPDPNFHITTRESLTGACTQEIALDVRVRNTVAYGSFLLLNQIDRDGAIDGRAVYVMNLGERNEALRRRFGARSWYRYEVPLSSKDSLPVLVPYESPR
ncbi:MAG TPA: hypothetical protein VJ867_06130 [Gemmatimonadaceae bacterium]|nr:hypothetical protein [Gemmatimonadaceae bacterium]